MKANSKNNEVKERLQIALSIQNLSNDREVENQIKKMNIKSNYLIINQIDNKKVDINNPKVITKFEKGLTKSRNMAIDKSIGDIILLADDDVIYNDDYEKIIYEAYEKYKDADIICFFVESKNPKRKIKRLPTGKIGFIKAMKIVSFEMSFRKKSIINNKLKFDERFGAGTKLNRGEEQIFLYSALKKGMKIIFVNKKIAEVEQSDSSWFSKYDEKFFTIQGKIFKELTSKFYLFLIVQYAIRKYFLYRKDISFFRALKCMLKN